eukprot:1161031-Pelagomonas_calceolata.AAC.3
MKEWFIHPALPYGRSGKMRTSCLVHKGEKLLPMILQLMYPLRLSSTWRTFTEKECLMVQSALTSSGEHIDAFSVDSEGFVAITILIGDYVATTIYRVWRVDSGDYVTIATHILEAWEERCTQLAAAGLPALSAPQFIYSNLRDVEQILKVGLQTDEYALETQGIKEGRLEKRNPLRLALVYGWMAGRQCILEEIVHKATAESWERNVLCAAEGASSSVFASSLTPLSAAMSRYPFL